MSTSYYRIAKPFTNIKIEHENGMSTILLWVGSHQSGEVFVPTEFEHEVLRPFFRHEEDNECPLRTWWGGKRGTVVEEHGGPLPDEAPVLDEYGRLLTAGKVRARKGAGRKDGMPTELFGYED